jgi:hypothetical protein
MLPTALTDLVTHGHWTYGNYDINDVQADNDPATRHQAAGELSASIEKIERIGLSKSTVVGDYRRYDEAARTELISRKNSIENALTHMSNSHRNYLVWAAPGSGKTYFIRQIAAAMGARIRYEEVNVSSDTLKDLKEKIDLVHQETRPVLFLIDEVDTSMPTIAYPEFFSYLDMNLTSQNNIVFVLVGSQKGGRESMVAGISSREKGADMLDRVPVAHRFDVPPGSTEDLALVLLSQAHAASTGKAPPLSRVQKAAVFFALENRIHRSPRQLAALAQRAAARLVGPELNFDCMFDPNDIRQYEFASENLSSLRNLWNTYIEIED